MIALSNVPSDPHDRMLRMKALAGAVPHGAEAAIRAWATTNARVRIVQQRVDGERLAALTDVVHGLVPDRAEAGRLAVLGMSLLVGLQQWRAPVEPAELNMAFDEFEATIRRHAAAHGGRRAGPARPRS